MKFITLLFAFIATYTVYAYDDTYVKCENELKKYEECFSKLTPDTLEQACSAFKSEKCQQFLNDPFTYAPTCQKDIVYSKDLHPIIMNYLNQRILLTCQKDEAGNPCPLSKQTLMEFTNRFYYGDSEIVEEMNKAKEDTCKSNICREVTYKAYADIQVTRNYYDEKIALGHIRIEEAVLKEEIAKYLDSKECKAMSGAKQDSANSNDAKQDSANSNDAKQESNSKNSNDSNDASTHKTVTGISIILGLLLLYLY